MIPSIPFVKAEVDTKRNAFIEDLEKELLRRIYLAHCSFIISGRNIVNYMQTDTSSKNVSKVNFSLI